jgi:hypothetical protein
VFPIEATILLKLMSCLFPEAQHRVSYVLNHITPFTKVRVISSVRLLNFTVALPGVGLDANKDLLVDICGTDGIVYMIDNFSVLSTLTDVLIEDVQKIVSK